MTPLPSPALAFRRRSLLGLLGALPCSVAAWSGARAQAVLPPSARLLVPGPDAGSHARWAERLALALSQSGSAAVRLRLDVLGGPDGVTAANRFGTEAAPDGRSLMVLSGGTAQARLAGDPRARFDSAGWLPVCASLGCAVLMGREPRPQAMPGAAPLRVAVGAPEGSGAAALLALDLLGLPAVALPGPAAPHWQDGTAQVVLLAGTEVPGRLMALGAQPWCVLDAGPGERDPMLPEVPSLADLAGNASPPLLAACRAAGAAARLLAALVLPALTPADQVALWRTAAQRWLEEETRIAQAATGPAVYGQSVTGLAVPGAEAAALLASMSPPPEALLAYREWLLRRLGWQAG